MIKRVRPGQNKRMGVVDTPQYPGQQKGNSREEVRRYVQDQVRRKGFTHSGGITTTSFKITLSGTARFLYGLTFLNSFPATATLTINNEVVFEDVHIGFMLFGATNQDYYAVNRPLSGTDDIKLSINATAAYTSQPSEFIYK